MTRANDDSPTKRVVLGYQGSEYVVELYSNVISVRPKGSKRGGPLDHSITPSALHDRLVRASIEADKPRRPRGRQVGRLG